MDNPDSSEPHGVAISDLISDVYQIKDDLCSLKEGQNELREDRDNLTKQIAKLQAGFDGLKLQFAAMAHQLAESELNSKRERIVEKMLEVNAEACLNWSHYSDDTAYMMRMTDMLDDLKCLGLKRPYPAMCKLRGLEETKFNGNESTPVRLSREDFLF